MSEQQHTKDRKDGLTHRNARTKSGDGGSCLNRHIAGQPKEQERNTCSHRWQSYLATVERHDDYDAPKYDSLFGKKSKTVKTAQQQGFPPWYTATIPAPSGTAWNVTGNNFYTKCTVPYWHEAHHVIPNSTLRDAINALGKDADAPADLVRVVRGGLLDEKYNLNHRSNMITLPMDTKVSNAIRLPVHRRTAAHRSHATYSRNVKTQLTKIFQPLSKAIKEHKDPDYSAVKMQLLTLSEALILQIRMFMKVGDTGKSLDQLFNP